MAEHTPPPNVGVNLHSAAVRASLQKYWRTNLAIMGVLLIIWAVAGLGAGVVFAAELNELNLPGTAIPLGFWFAHQGSIVVFLLVVLAYCFLMNRLDARHHLELETIREQEKRA